jgi:hypothetical protein
MTKIKLGNIEINHMSQSSAVLSGVNIPTKWSHRSQSSEGFGKIHGNQNNVTKNTTIVKNKEDK